MKKIFLAIGFCLVSLVSRAQDDLLSQLEDDSQNEKVIATFKGSRLINGQSVETRHKGELEFIFAHRFGSVKGGFYELFGLDQAFVRIGLEYGITDTFGLGVGRNSFDKTMDGYVRYKVLSQSGNMPVTLTAFGNMAIKTSPKKEDATYDITVTDRISYSTQLLIARKFNSSISLQLMPSWVHKNTVDQSIERNDQIAIGIGGRVKVSRSVAIISEYYYRINVPDSNPYHNPLGFGVEIETGGHVFQVVITNSQGLTERAFITETTGDFFDGDIHLGFNITRSFQPGGKKNR